MVVLVLLEQTLTEKIVVNSTETVEEKRGRKEKTRLEEMTLASTKAGSQNVFSTREHQWSTTTTTRENPVKKTERNTKQYAGHRQQVSPHFQMRYTGCHLVVTLYHTLCHPVSHPVSPCIPPCVTLYPIFDTKLFIPEDLTTNRLAEVNQWKDKKFRSSEEEDCPKRSKSQVKLVTKGMKLVTKGANTFGSLLFKDLTKSQNLVFSPFSLSTGLAMLTPGAKGETLKQVKILF